ncbi:hypothetical protein HK096_010702 [Nowakowskiella sp. JEL0078]|nr:hypothetical protein HK096_010702 [Nowakowskiella sp. JEL0078]
MCVKFMSFELVSENEDNDDDMMCVDETDYEFRDDSSVHPKIADNNGCEFENNSNKKFESAESIYIDVPPPQKQKESLPSLPLNSPPPVVHAHPYPDRPFGARSRLQNSADQPLLQNPPELLRYETMANVSEQFQQLNMVNASPIVSERSFNSSGSSFSRQSKLEITKQKVKEQGRNVDEWDIADLDHPESLVHDNINDQEVNMPLQNGDELKGLITESNLIFGTQKWGDIELESNIGDSENGVNSATNNLEETKQEDISSKAVASQSQSETIFWDDDEDVPPTDWVKKRKESENSNTGKIMSPSYPPTESYPPKQPSQSSKATFDGSLNINIKVSNKTNTNNTINRSNNWNTSRPARNSRGNNITKSLPQFDLDKKKEEESPVKGSNAFSSKSATYSTQMYEHSPRPKKFTSPPGSNQPPPATTSNSGKFTSKSSSKKYEPPPLPVYDLSDTNKSIAYPGRLPYTSSHSEDRFKSKSNLEQSSSKNANLSPTWRSNEQKNSHFSNDSSRDYSDGANLSHPPRSKSQHDSRVIHVEAIQKTEEVKIIVATITETKIFKIGQGITMKILMNLKLDAMTK